MKEGVTLVHTGGLDGRILLLRGLRVMLDTDLAEIYGVPTKRLNEQVRRNRRRFPSDFMFQLTLVEKEEVVANCDHLRKLKFSPNQPYAFTEHGAVMLASVLNSERAVETSVQIIRAFIRLRELIGVHRDLARKLEGLEKRYDGQFKVVFQALRQIMAPPAQKTRRIGFRAARS